MLELLLILAGIVLAFLLFIALAATYTSRAFARIASQHREDTQWLLDTGVAPSRWSEPERRRLEKLMAAGADEARIARARAASKQRLLARLHRHLRHLERSNVFPDARTRTDVTGRIRAIGRAWERASWDQIVGEEAFEVAWGDA